MNIRQDWQVESYRPAVLAALEIYQPALIMELGVGVYSTQLFPDKGYIGIESDPEWFAEIIRRYPKKHFILHDLPELHHLTRLWELSVEQIADIRSYYNDLFIPKRKSLLFVDNYSCCRSIAINALWQKFDVTIFHDCQPEAWQANGYNTLTVDRPIQYLRTNDNWTGIIGDVSGAIQPYIDDFIKQYPECKMSLL